VEFASKALSVREQTLMNVLRHPQLNGEGRFARDHVATEATLHGLGVCI
jgi:hypothetical protein